MPSSLCLSTCTSRLRENSQSWLSIKQTSWKVKDTISSRLTSLGLPTLCLWRIKCSDYFHRGIRFGGKASRQGFLDSAVGIGTGRARASQDIYRSRCQNSNHSSLSGLPKALFTKVEVLVEILVKSSADHSHSAYWSALRSSYWICSTSCLSLLQNILVNCIKRATLS